MDENPSWGSTQNGVKNRAATAERSSRWMSYELALCFLVGEDA
jgi:hypothetical protein